MERRPDVIETARLIGRAPTAQDFYALRRLYADPRIMDFLAVDRQPYSDGQIRSALQRILVHFERYGFGAWFFHERESGDFVGYCGLKHSVFESAAMVELLYAVRSLFWRKGYASEAAEACLAYGFDRLGLEEIVAIALPRNHGSRAVMERCGLIYQRPIRHAGLPHCLYRLRRPVSPPGRRKRGTGARS